MYKLNGAHESIFDLCAWLQDILHFGRLFQSPWWVWESISFFFPAAQQFNLSHNSLNEMKTLLMFSSARCKIVSAKHL